MNPPLKMFLDRKLAPEKKRLQKRLLGRKQKPPLIEVLFSGLYLTGDRSGLQRWIFRPLKVRLLVEAMNGKGLKK